eukprot:TRINITY_DN21794_c0_g1_i2.p2 TRINITY_DN21794_c0_g1~~TRINITY_DN21794_c0_g1_i2.p2  ORF type:complete len:322 (+),score=91.18 TRINITY_DN21794_c0_g1_i2:70-1035(+)
MPPKVPKGKKQAAPKVSTELAAAPAKKEAAKAKPSKKKGADGPADATAKAAPTKKKKTEEKPAAVSEPASKFSDIDRALADASMPEHICAMLRAVLPHCLEKPLSDRHEYEVGVLDMVREALEQTEDSLRKASEDSADKHRLATEERDSRDEAVVAATKVLEEAAAQTQAKAKAAEDARAALQDGRGKLTMARREQAEGDAPAVSAEGNAAALSAAVKDVFEPLRAAGCCDKPDLNASLAELERAGKACQVESSLMDSLACALKKAPDSRGAFDSIVLEQFDKQAAARIEKLTLPSEQHLRLVQCALTIAVTSQWPCMVFV